MKINIAKTFSKDFDKTSKKRDIEELEIKLKSSLEKNEYGCAIADYLIGIICVHPNFEPFFQPKKPLFVENRKIKLEGLNVNIHKTFSLDIKLDYNHYYHSDKESGLRIIANAITETIRDLKYPTKIKDFDKERFYNDLLLFFNGEGLI